jgi:hypothetical protein
MRQPPPVRPVLASWRRGRRGKRTGEDAGRDGDDIPQRTSTQ